MTSLSSKRSLTEQSSSEPPSNQPIINHGEDSDENSDNDSGFASVLKGVKHPAGIMWKRQRII